MTTRQKRKEHITKARRRQILEAALTVFSSKGFGQATIADIANEADVGIGTIYNYYKDKHDLLISLVTSALISPDLSRIMGNIAKPEATRNSKQFIQSLFQERLGFALANAQRLLFLMFEIQRDARLRKQFVSQVVSPLLVSTEKYIRIQINQGSFRQVDERIIARTLVGAIIGNAILYCLELGESPLKKSRVPEISVELTDFFMRGMMDPQ
jgi:AcrR family transcriptional regulator